MDLVCLIGKRLGGRILADDDDDFCCCTLNGGLGLLCYFWSLFPISAALIWQWKLWLNKPDESGFRSEFGWNWNLLIVFIKPCFEVGMNAQHSKVLTPKNMKLCKHETHVLHDHFSQNSKCNQIIELKGFFCLGFDYIVEMVLLR